MQLWQPLQTIVHVMKACHRSSLPNLTATPQSSSHAKAQRLIRTALSAERIVHNTRKMQVSTVRINPNEGYRMMSAYSETQCGTQGLFRQNCALLSSKLSSSSKGKAVTHKVARQIKEQAAHGSRRAPVPQVPARTLLSDVADHRQLFCCAADLLPCAV